MSEQTRNPSVLILHGIWNLRLWVLPLTWHLRAAGFAANAFGYSSVFRNPETAMTQLAEKLRRSNTRTCLIGHSLGGLIALETLRQAPELPVSRVVCLGSPLQGSRTAHSLIQRGFGRWTLGHSAALLQSGCAPWQSRTQIGMIAGNVPRGLGRLLAQLDGPSDGTVLLSETHQPYLTDHCTVHTSHSGLLFSTEVARQSAHFLQNGQFMRSVSTNSTTSPAYSMADHGKP